MSDQAIRGAPVLDVTSSGCTPDSRYIWLHFKLPQGNEHNFFIDVAHVDETIGMMREAAGQAYDLQANPASGAGEGDASVTPMPVKTICHSEPGAGPLSEERSVRHSQKIPRYARDDSLTHAVLRFLSVVP